MSQSPLPRILVTVTVPGRHPDPDLATRKNRLYADAIERHGGLPIVIDGTADPAEQAAAFGSMEGLLLTGGADIDPTRYGASNLGSVDIEPERDELESAAWAAADARGLPVLGICRGFQAINVFSGGTLLQDLAGHAGPGWSAGPASIHPLRLEGDARLTDLAPGLVATGWAASEAGDLVEVFEGSGSRFVVGVQCHPERTESTPAGFEALWQAFVDACRPPARAGAGQEAPAVSSAVSGD